MSETVTWADVHEGDVLQGKDGNAWTVVAVEIVGPDAWEFSLIREGAAMFTAKVPSAATVTRLESGLPAALPGADEDRVAEVAEAIVAVQLGGAVVAHQDEQGRWWIPVKPWTLPDLHAHLTIFHALGPTGRPSTLAELIDFHERDHAGFHGDRKGYTAHIHDEAKR